MPARSQHRLRLASLRKDAPTAFEYSPSEAQAAALKDRLDLLNLRKMRLAGQIAPEGRSDWRLTAHLGATVVQPCSITLEPVTTRIDEPVARRYTDDFTMPIDGEAEMPEDETLEPLPETIDLFELAAEALSLCLPAFPRAEGAGMAEMSAAPPGAAPLDAQDRAPSPFSALANLKRQMEE